MSKRLSNDEIEMHRDHMHRMTEIRRWRDERAALQRQQTEMAA